MPEEEALEVADLPSSSSDQSSQPQQSMTAPASLSQNWRFSPINSPSGSPSEAVATARSVGNGWRRTTSLRRTGSSSENAAGGLMPERCDSVNHALLCLHAEVLEVEDSLHCVLVLRYVMVRLPSLMAHLAGMPHVKADMCMLWCSTGSIS